MDALDIAIRQQRTSHTTVTLTRGGIPLASQEVLVEQKKHKFFLGAFGEKAPSPW